MLTQLERVTLPQRAVVCDPGKPIEYAYFPLTNLLSSVVVMGNGLAVEAATIGHEGMAGLALMVDERASPGRVIQQIEGESLRLPARRFRQLYADSRALQSLVQRYSLTLVQQCAQNAACNLLHSIERRMCRWLLMAADSVQRDAFSITQQFLASMLGVRRQSVNAVIGQLYAAGLIEHRRSHIAVMDRGSLELAACECYGATRSMYEQLMGSAHPAG